MMQYVNLRMNDDIAELGSAVKHFKTMAVEATQKKEMDNRIKVLKTRSAKIHLLGQVMRGEK